MVRPNVLLRCQGKTLFPLLVGLLGGATGAGRTSSCNKGQIYVRHADHLLSLLASSMMSRWIITGTRPQRNVGRLLQQLPSLQAFLVFNT